MRTNTALCFAIALGLGSACAAGAIGGDYDDFDESQPADSEELEARVLEAFDIISANQTEVPEMTTAIAFGGFDIDEEPIYVKNRECSMYFLGVNLPQADQYAIWNLGVGGVVDGAEYPSDDRPNLYAILAPAAADRTHHVDGFDQFDHYHLAERKTFERGQSMNAQWDVYFVFPGSNFDANTYEVATDIAGMEAQVAAGILGTPLLTTEAGFEPLVLQTPVLCWQ